MAAGTKGGLMRFLLRVTFAIGLIIFLLQMMPDSHVPAGSSPSQVSTTEAVSAANAAVSDMRQFCSRQPDACTIGNQIITQMGQKAEMAAKLLYEFLNEKFGEHPAASAEDPSEKSTLNTKPAQNTLNPADLNLPWHGTAPRKDADPKRPG